MVCAQPSALYYSYKSTVQKFDDKGLPWELLYADDLVLLEDDLKRKLQRWKNGLEAKGLRVNVGETKVMKCRVGLQKVVDSGKYPCWQGSN